VADARYIPVGLNRVNVLSCSVGSGMKDHEPQRDIGGEAEQLDKQQRASTELVGTKAAPRLAYRRSGFTASWVGPRCARLRSNGSVARGLVVLVTVFGLLASPLVASGRQVMIGRSVRGRAIAAEVLGPDSAPRKILVVGCIHGNECAGVAILSALARQRVPSGVQLWLVPEINPDGTAAHTRQNARGVDLNRNFPFRWRPIASPSYYAGPRPLSEPETRAAVALISAIHPVVTIWYHQHEDLVDMAGGDRGIARRYARSVGLRATCLPFLPGTATAWSNHTFPGTTSFVVELPAGRVTRTALAVHVAALEGVAQGRRVGSRTGCGR
jgi:protein MpaA